MLQKNKSSLLIVLVLLICVKKRKFIQFLTKVGRFSHNDCVPEDVVASDLAASEAASKFQRSRKRHFVNTSSGTSTTEHASYFDWQFNRS